MTETTPPMPRDISRFGIYDLVPVNPRCGRRIPGTTQWLALTALRSGQGLLPIDHYFDKMAHLLDATGLDHLA